MSCFLPLYLSQGYRKVKLCCEDVQGTSVLTNFHGMDLTRDKLCSLIKKWQTLIEGQVDVRTTDGYLLRIFDSPLFYGRTLPRWLRVPSFVNANTFGGAPFPMVDLRRILAQSCIGFTKKQENQIKQTCYAQASQIRAVRKKMCDIMSEE
ncbi:unnamed protein product, partial [Ectocarpus sp. 12 AP-2014]